MKSREIHAKHKQELKNIIETEKQKLYGQTLTESTLIDDQSPNGVQNEQAKADASTLEGLKDIEDEELSGEILTASNYNSVATKKKKKNNVNNKANMNNSQFPMFARFNAAPAVPPAVKLVICQLCSKYKLLDA